MNNNLLLCSTPQWAIILISILLSVSSIARATTRSETDLARLAEYSAATARLPGRAGCPPAFGVDVRLNAQIQGALARLLEHGAPRAADVFMVDEQAVRDAPMPATPYLLPRLRQDTETGRFIAGPELELAGGVGASVWFFYNNFFAAYAGLHPEFRRADSPLARGAAALAAFGNSHRGNLALLPAFKPEAALALLLFNADPELPDAMRARPPADADLQARVSAAMRRAGAPDGADNTGIILGRPGVARSGLMFDARRLVSSQSGMRDELWRFAVANVAHPGLLAEIGGWLWVGRAPDARAAATLDDIATRRMLDVLDRDLRAREIPADAADQQAVFDTSQLPSIFTFIWAYRPEFAAWRRAVSAAAAVTDNAARLAQMLELKARLADMLRVESPATVAPAARLCAMTGAPPEIELGLTPRDDIGGSMARLTVAWRISRPLPDGAADQERPVFNAAAAMVLFDAGAEVEAKRIAFVASGLEAAAGAARAESLRFTAGELDRFDALLSGLRRAWSRARWDVSRARAPARLRRLLVLCFVPEDNPEWDTADFIAAWMRTPAAIRPPVWVSVLFDECLAARADFLQKGAPGSLSDWLRRYMPLLALAYETGNIDFGDALARDFIAVAMTLELGKNPEQPARHVIAGGGLLRRQMDEALHWSRDVISMARDGGDGRQAWLNSDGWEHLIKDALPGLAGAGAAETIMRRSDGAVELGNLWIQIRKIRHGASDGDDAAAIRAVLEGAAEYRFTYLLAAPSQNPDELYSLAPFDKSSPYAARGDLRGVLGIDIAGAPQPSEV